MSFGKEIAVVLVVTLLAKITPVSAEGLDGVTIAVEGKFPGHRAPMQTKIEIRGSSLTYNLGGDIYNIPLGGSITATKSPGDCPGTVTATLVCGDKRKCAPIRAQSHS
jgi:hypothetical protein